MEEEWQQKWLHFRFIREKNNLGTYEERVEPDLSLKYKYGGSKMDS